MCLVRRRSGEERARKYRTVVARLPVETSLEARSAHHHHLDPERRVLSADAKSPPRNWAMSARARQRRFFHRPVGSRHGRLYSLLADFLMRVLQIVQGLSNQSEFRDLLLD
jgi:hypothetical protein